MMLEMYRRMVRIREFEDTSINLFLRGELKGAATTYNGMEASAVGVCMALRREDLIAGTHRGHGHIIAKGADTKKMMAELLGKETVGAAMAFRMRGEDRVAVPFTGDGGTNTGNFHEGLNMASIWDLPLVLVVENNQYGVSTHISESCNIDDLSSRAESYGIPGVRVDGFDVLAVYEVAVEAVERARRGQGPTLLVTECYRFEGHYAGEPQVYRERAEVQEYIKKDPIPRLSKYLVEGAIASQDEVDAIDAEIKQEMVEAVKFAKESPEPDPATALDYNYA
jgi:pyruvate dehydrogenase E1 component alpha subunit